MWDLQGSISLPRESGGLVLCLAGEVDAAVVWEFEARHGPPVPVAAIDAGAVTFICGHGVTLMVDWARTSAAAGHRAVLRRSARAVDRVLRLAGLDGELTREASRVG
jgi:anti-anti-sigma regulatory factor